MADKTAIEWTDATWNPVTGCTEVSPGCDRCYAKTFAERWRGIPGHHFENGFDVQLRPDKLGLPLTWTRPRQIFVNSMSDLYHGQVPDDYVAQVFAVMLAAGRHTFQVLTKRPARMRALQRSDDFRSEVWERAASHLLGRPVVPRGHPKHAPWPPPNIWLGASVEDQHWAGIRIPVLEKTPAAVRFLSCEPLLGPVDLDLNRTDPTELDGPPRRDRIDWVIVGGESGPGARPMHPDWARSIRDQCVAAGVPFLFKQWGEWAPMYNLRAESASGPRVREEHLISTDRGIIRMHRVGKKAAGRELDGRAWDEYPPAVCP